MWRETLREYLFPGAAESEPEFRDEIRRVSRLSLRVIGTAQIAVALFMLLARVLVSPDPYSSQFRIAQAIWIIALGFCCLLLARMKAVQAWSRSVALTMSLAVIAVLIWYSLRMVIFSPTADDLIPGQITLVMLVVVASVPAQPWQTLAFGSATGAIYIAAAELTEKIYHAGTGPNSITISFVVLLTLLSTALSALMYVQRMDNYRSSQSSRQAEARTLLAENAASLGRLAAAISHELNSPLGALISSVDTLLLVAARQATSDKPEEQQRLVRLQGDLRKSIRDSVQRLQQMVTRVQRFTNLDHAEVQVININELVADVTAMLGSEISAKAKLETDLQPLEPIVCRPQQISAVLSSLLHNALNSLNGDGEVCIRTKQLSDGVEVGIRDNGQGMCEEDLRSIFDPGFKVRGGKVRATNWSLFSSRQIVRQHGGDIRISSRVGEGTEVVVTLPKE
jgi:signal transduction histidine kinase